MESTAIYSVETLQDRLEFIRKCPGPDILAMCASITDLNDQLPQEYLAQLNELERIICLRASLICWSVTEGTQVPRIMQLRSILADRLGRNRTPEYTDKGWIPK